jgi:heme/copper-type cytochrome/quinol oxidase subunit 4
MQSRRKSLEETVVSTAIGFVCSTILNLTVVPALLGTRVSMVQNLTLTAVFTVASIARGFFVRRIYNGK